MLSVLVNAVRLTALLIVLCGLALAGAVVGIAKGYMETAPTLDLALLDDQDKTSFLYDAQGNVITELSEEGLKTDFVNLYATTPSGQQIKSSTFHMIGPDYNLALGINFDYTSLVYANRILVDLMSADADLKSAMWRSGDNRLGEVFEECLAVVGKPVSALNKSDRLKIIALLEQKEAFSFRKSVPFIAQRLGVSRYTVYKYLTELAQERAAGQSDSSNLPGD